jgi:hypothetical protein
MTSLSEKHRPRKLAEIVGQPGAVAAVKAKLRTGASFAVIAYGKPGLGKTSLAHAIAGELGCAEWQQGGGFRIVDSNQQGVDGLAEVFQTLAYRPLYGSKWRVVCFEECELKSRAAVNYLKTALEHLPPHVVILFTSNADLDDFADDAIAERCLCLRFEHRADRLAGEAQALVSRVWESTLGRNHAPTLADLGIDTGAGRLSFRAVLAALEPVLLAELPEPAPAEPVASPSREPEPVAVDTLPVPETKPEQAPVAPEPMPEPAPEPAKPKIARVIRYKRNVFGGADTVSLFLEDGREIVIEETEFASNGGMTAVRAGSYTVNLTEMGLAA